MRIDPLNRILKLQPHEAVPGLLSAAYFFLILCAYYLIKPLREEQGLAAGAENLPKVIWGTLGVMLIATPLFGALVRGRSRRTFIPIAYRFFALSFLLYLAGYLLIPKDSTLAVTNSIAFNARTSLGVAFYIWVSVFNLFANSLFWAFMADGFRFEQSKRLFGIIAVGGSIGATLGAAFALPISTHLGPAGMVLACVALLECAVQCVRALAPRFDAMAQQITSDPTASAPPAPPAPERQPSVWAGLMLTLRSPYLLAITGYLLFYALTSTIFYFQQAYIVQATFESSADRRAYFATVDFWVNLLTLFVQIFLTGRIMATFGIAATLALLPTLTLAGFLYVGLDPTFTPFVIVYVLRKVGNYALSRPARETLFTVVPRESKYQAKTFIDTFVYRAGDALASPFDLALRALHLGISGVAYASAPIAVAWLALAVYLGVRQRALAGVRESQAATPPLPGE